MKTELRKSMKQGSKLMRSMLITGLALLFSLPLSAQEKSEVKLNLPDGVYQFHGGCDFIIKDNQFYTPPGAIKIFGIAKLNEWFVGKKYKSLLDSEKIGGGYNSKISKKYSPCKPKMCSFPFETARYLTNKEIAQGPLYAREFAHNGSVLNVITVPDAYKETRRKLYRSISAEEVAAVEKLVNEKLFIELQNKKELDVRMSGRIQKFKFNDAAIKHAQLLMLDKIHQRGKVMFIGVFKYRFKTNDDIIGYQVMFSVIERSVKLITGTSEPTLNVLGMLDVDGDGEDELVVDRGHGADEYTGWQEIYKQQQDGSWLQIMKGEEFNCR